MERNPQMEHDQEEKAPPQRPRRKLLWLVVGGVILSVTLFIAGSIFTSVFLLQPVGVLVLILTIVSGLLIFLIRAARSRAWTGFVGKTLWDWMQLLIVPLVLVIGGFWLTTMQDNRQRAIEDQRAQDAALQAYLDEMSQLLLTRDLRGSEESSEVRTLARARTLTVLERLDAERKARVLRFLYEANLVNGSVPVIDLGGADLRGVRLTSAVVEESLLWQLGISSESLPVRASWRGINVSGAYLNDAWLDADLSEADLRKADLTGAFLGFANLSGADLRDANLSDTSLIEADLSGANLEGAVITKKQLNDCKSLEGATMPNGQKYEDWLKSKGSGEE